MLDLSLRLGFRRSTDSSGSNWEPVIIPPVPAIADYPSVARAPDGRIVIAFNRVNVFGFVTGFQTVVSPDNGANWSGPFTITDSAAEGVFGRVVFSGGAFHVFLINTVNHPTWVLKRFQSPDGMTPWTEISPPLDTYTAPAPFSQDANGNPIDFCGGGRCGAIHYARNLDAAASSGLGWVLLYPVAVAGPINNLKFCVESQGGCIQITWSNDLFLHGITTSSSGDLWISEFTYASDTARTLPLRHIAAYWTPTGNSTGVVSNDIEPTSWRFGPAGSFLSSRCGFNNCFSAGDYMRPAMNIFTGASLPLVHQAPPGFPRQTDLLQHFVQDPPVGLPPVPGMRFGPLQPFGSDSRFPGTLPPGAIRARNPDTIPSGRLLSRR